MKNLTWCFLLSTLIAPLSLCNGQDGDSNITFPFKRYVEWSMLPPESLTAAQGLGYVGESDWNLPGTADIEAINYATNAATVTDFVTHADALDLNEETWNCYINHYDNYNWTELGLEQVQADFETLGYTEQSWEDDTNADPPASEDKFWEELTNEERAAAENICFFEELWNEIPLSFWELDSTTTVAPATPAPTITPGSPTAAPATDQPTVTAAAPPQQGGDIPIPEFRFIEWSEQSTENQDFATQLSYTEDTWNSPGTAAIESLSYSTIEMSTPQLVPAVTGLGFTEASWDCYANHYVGYTWTELETAGVQVHLVTLGWSRANWENSGTAATEDKLWAELTAEERMAANAICYVQPLWDEIALTEWGDDDPFGPTSAPAPSSGDGGTSMSSPSAPAPPSGDGGTSMSSSALSIKNIKVSALFAFVVAAYFVAIEIVIS